jgi:hypothetical protein
MHRSRGRDSARVMLQTSALEQRGRRECRVFGTPAAARALVESTRVSHRRLAETVRHSLRDGFSGLSSCSPRSAGLDSLRRLADVNREA